MKKRTLGLLLALTLTLGCLAGGTLAYLTSQTDTVTNTFTVGSVAIDLTETKAPDGSALTAAKGWTQLTSENVWYRTVAAADTTRAWHLIDGDTVAVSTELTNETMPQSSLTLAYTAYAVQTAGFTTAADAWEATFGA